MMALLEFLVAHVGLIEAIRDAVDAGASREEILRGIRATQIAASDAAMRAELGQS